METLPKSPVLKFRPDTLTVVRKTCDLDGPGRMKQAIDILDDWIKKQEHFHKKDFSRDYLEITLICCKGFIERAKMRLDKVCTLRTYMQDLFGNFDLKNDFSVLGEKLVMSPVSTLTEDNYRVLMCRYNSMLDAKELTQLYRATLILFEYLRVHDYMNGYIVFVDLGDLNMLDLVSNMNLVEMRHLMTAVVEGYGVRLKGCYLLSKSKLIDALVSVLKQILSAKLSNRLHVLKTVEEFHKHVPKEILPKDYGGNEKSLAALHDDLIKEMSSEEFTKYRKEMNEARTNETLRSVATFNDQHMGIPGTFRTLSLD